MAAKKENTRKKQSETPAAKPGKKSGNDQPGTTEVPDYWLNKRQACESYGITASAFDKWKVEPVARRGNCNYYDVRTLVENRVDAALRRERLQRPDDDDQDRPDPIKEQAGLAREKKIAQALKNAVTRGELIPAEVVGLVIGKIATEMAATLDALPGQIKRIEPGMSATTLEEIKREIVTAQNAAAGVDRYLDEFIDDFSAADTGD